MKQLKLIIIFLALVVLTSCGKKQEQQTEQKEEHHDENSNEVSLTAEQIKLMGIRTKPISDVNISGYIKVTGEVKINQEQESKVGGIISGRVKSVAVKEGSSVRAGQVLATIENVELVGVQSDYITAKNELEYAKQELDRQKKISDLTSKKTLAELEANYKRALTNVRSIEQRLSSYKINKNNLDNVLSDSTASVQRYYSIVAPISGNIVQRTISVGQFVEPSTEMFHIVNTSSVIVDLNIFEKDLSKISKGQKVQIETSTYAGEVFTGTIANINTVFDDASRTVKVRVLIQNKANKLLPNMFVTAKILVEEGNVKAVPKSALIEEGEEKYIFVKTDRHEHSIKEKEEHKESKKEEENHTNEHSEGTIFKKIMVRVGIEDDTFIEIFPITEFDEDNEVVTEGTFFLRSESKKDELGEHDH
ncbi:MAG: efflux RND transporter periplasmic adaptor subunit [Ignavibacteria bacterium]|jgi:cobalt-zinc-cadmium efflux system membrane fusion protein|nr:efflux RND transporter periplasmic adaptor subunit [Ignavibacteria bacterium]